MKILVLSDSHGNISNMLQAAERESPRLILHLGDCWRDGERLHDRLPELSLEQVPGNCDFRGSQPTERLLFLGDMRILMCHGHTYGVKQSLMRAGLAAEEKNLDLFLFGHTHKPLVDKAGKDAVFEPRQHRGLCPAHLWNRDPGKWEAGRPDSAAAKVNQETRESIKYL